MKLRQLLLSLLLLLSVTNLRAQIYYPPKDTLVQKKLKEWGDRKFGLLMHWGTYSQWGIVESWSICPEDEDWCRRRGPYAGDYYRYKQAYENLQTTFNPVNFAPEKWAAAAREAGMKYLVFTTKHHDGFCMFDTKQTDYRVTSEKCPFSRDPRANITKEVFNAFRKEGLWVGAYFSKPDWHSPYFWDPIYPPFDRNVNYDIARHRLLWDQFKDFTHRQIRELMSEYGKVDILWLDGGWVRPFGKGEDHKGKTTAAMDIDIAKLGSIARMLQPGILVVDRDVEDEYQDYLTPEQQVPDKPLSYPWETCMTMATSWSFVPNDQYKPTTTLIHNLATIVSRGGNYLLNIGPAPDGTLADTAYARLKEIGAWMKINSEAIYATHPVAPYQTGKVVFTQTAKGDVYAIYLADANEKELPSEISLGAVKVPGKKVQLLGSRTGCQLSRKGDTFVISIPAGARKEIPCRHAWVFRISK